MSSTVEKSHSSVAKRGSPKPVAYANVTSNTTTALVAGVSGKLTRVFKIFISGTATVAIGVLTFKDGATTKLVRQVPVVTLGGLENCVDFGGHPWELADGSDLNLVTTGATAMNYHVSVSYDQFAPNT